MRVRKLTATGDYSFGHSQADFWRDVPEAVAQNVKTSLLLWLNEWFLDTSLGTPYMQGILGKHSKQMADTTIQDQVTQVDGVVNISQFESTLDADSRGLDVALNINTIFGPTSVQIANYGTY